MPISSPVKAHDLCSMVVPDGNSRLLWLDVRISGSIHAVCFMRLLCVDGSNLANSSLLRSTEIAREIIHRWVTLYDRAQAECFSSAPGGLLCPFRLTMGSIPHF